MKKIENYNVMLYNEFNVDSDGQKYHLLDLSLFDGNKLVKQNFLYVNDMSYDIALKELYKIETLDNLINRPRNSKINFSITTIINY